jgi:hypothetical protein
MDQGQYNYPNFPLDMQATDFAAFDAHLPVGSPAPDGQLIDAATGEIAQLSYLWKESPLVIEFGSAT